MKKWLKSFKRYISLYEDTCNSNTTILKKSLLFEHIDCTSNDNMINSLYDSYITKKYTKLYSSIFYDNYIDTLNEGLTMTMEYDMFIEKVSSYFDFDVYADYMDNNNAISKVILVSLFKDDYLLNKKDIESFIMNCGYFISSSYEDTIDEFLVIHLLVEPKYITEATEFINALLFLYHITVMKRYNKIKKMGLCPRSGSKLSFHPERIYFFYQNYPENIFKRQAEHLYKPGGTYRQNVKGLVDDKGLEICIMRIDLHKFKRFLYRFFYDPNHPLGVFTYENVYPGCIEKLYSFYI